MSDAPTRTMVAFAFMFMLLAMLMAPVCSQEVGSPAAMAVPLADAYAGLAAAFTFLPSPDSITIVADACDQAFFADFSFLLGRVTCRWAEPEDGSVPSDAWAGNVFVVAHPHSPHAWDVACSLLPPGKAESVYEDDNFTVYAMPNPYVPEKALLVCVAPTPEGAMNAVEGVVCALMGDNGHESWLCPPYESKGYVEIRSYLDSIMYIPDTIEPPIGAMDADPSDTGTRSVSRAGAIEDVEFLFELFTHGYSGYGYFGPDAFEAAERAILSGLSCQDVWSSHDLTDLLVGNLNFVNDCHLRIDGVRFCRDLDFYYAEDSYLCTVSAGTYYLKHQGAMWELSEVAGHRLSDCLFPSLGEDGAATYRLGILSTTRVDSLAVSLQSGVETQVVEIALFSSPSYPNDVYRTDTVGGIPVIRVGSLGDANKAQLDSFLASAATYHGEPYLIIDLRGNGGGNTSWARTWVEAFSGSTPSNPLTFSELNTATAYMGRHNYFAYALEHYSGLDRDFYTSQHDAFLSKAEQFVHYALTPYWTHGFISSNNLIECETTVIVITDGNIYSAGEGFLAYLLQLESTVVVGENTGGGLTFGQMTMHRLPNSNIGVALPISLNVFVDLVFREGKGIYPDLWVPAADALNYAVAAVRSGLLGTVADVDESYFSGDFEREQYPVAGGGIPYRVLVPATLCAVVVTINVIRKKRKQ